MEQQEFSQEELDTLLSRYAIGKKPLSVLLGWGETTILRYTNGVPPNGEFAGQLRRIYEEPLEYLSILEQNRTRITSVAYRKSRDAVIRCVTATKLQCAVWYLIDLTDADCSPSRICMTLYYAQAISLGLYETALFSEDCDLSQDGEVPYERICQHLKSSGIRRLFGAEGLLSTKEETLLRTVHDILYQYGPGVLKERFRLEGAYIRKSKTEGGGKKIRNAALALYFKKIVQNGQFTRPEDFERYFRERGKRKKQGCRNKTALSDTGKT